MQMRKSPPELIDKFMEVVPGPPAETRKMFGYPSGFVNGNMFMGLFADNMLLRLPEPQREELMRMGAKTFEPMPGRPMREYVVLPASILANRSALSSWVAKSLAFGKSLPAKKKKPVKSGKTTRQR